MPRCNPLTEQDLKKWILRRLGSPVTRVCLDALQLDDAVEEAIRWFAAKKGVDRDITIDLFAGQVEYRMPDDCDMVVDVAFQVSPLDISLIFAPYNIAQDERVPYSVFTQGASGGLYSSLLQSLQYVEMAKRMVNAEKNWIYYPHKNILLALPDPKGGGKAVIEYKSCCSNIEQLPERDQLLVRRYALAWAKQDLGMIYSKYSTWPTAQGQVSLNGDQLMAQARNEMDKLEEEIYESAKPMAFFTM
jgi:hypothetical protein